MRFLFAILSLMTVLVYSACTREKIEIDGPELHVASDDFQMIGALTASDSLVNFASDSVVSFNATFNEYVSYTITISGLESGAEKVFVGNGDEVNVDWAGNANSTFFLSETCEVNLTVLGLDGVQGNTMISIEKVMAPPGNLIADFEPLGSSAQLGFWEAPVDNNPTRLWCARVEGVSVEGSSAYRLQGVNHLSQANRFLGLAFSKPIIGVNGTQKSGVKFNVGTEVADDVWFNVWVFGEGKDESSLAIKFMQDDNEDGQHQGGTENGFEYLIDDVSHYGWKLFSIQYSQLSTGANLAFGGNGDKVHRPQLIAQIEYALWSKVSGQPVEVVFDYPIFTLHNPLGE